MGESGREPLDHRRKLGLTPLQKLPNPRASAASPPPYLPADSSLGPPGPRSPVGKPLTVSGLGRHASTRISLSTLGSSVLVYATPPWSDPLLGPSGDMREKVTGKVARKDLEGGG